MEKLKKHPKKCPNCNSKEVSYERHARTIGKFVCWDCEWSMDAVTGEILCPGKSDNE